MDKKTKAYIAENAKIQSEKEIARILGIKERKVRKEIQRQNKEWRRQAEKQEQEVLQVYLPKHLFAAFCSFLALTLLVYSNTFQASFHYDDIYYIQDNEAFRNLFNLGAIWAFDAPRFLTNITFALNYQLGELEVFGYHLINILIHAGTGFMVYLFTYLLFQTPRLAKHALASKGKMIAFLSALLFLVHPLQTQAVTYIVQRSAAMAALFYTAVCVFYLLGRTKQERRQYWIAFGLCFAAMFTKQTAFTLPLALFLCEIFLFPSQGRAAFIGKVKQLWPFFLTMMVLPILRYSEVLSHQATQMVGTQSITPQEYLMTQFRVIVTYLRLFFWPEGQSLYHAFLFSKSLTEANTFLCLILLVALLAGAFKLRKKQPLFAFGIFWFFLTLSIESSIIPIGHVIFEHRMYLPMVGLCPAVLSLFAIGIKNRKILIGIMTCVLIALSVTTYQRNKVWETDATLWDDVGKKYKGDFGKFKQKMAYNRETKKVVSKRIDSKPFSEWKREAQ